MKGERAFSHAALPHQLAPQGLSQETGGQIPLIFLLLPYSNSTLVMSYSLKAPPSPTDSQSHTLTRSSTHFPKIPRTPSLAI